MSSDHDWNGSNIIHVDFFSIPFWFLNDLQSTTGSSHYLLKVTSSILNNN